MTKGSTSAPAWTPSEGAERCAALGARVELKGTKYRVYPPGGGGPVFFSAQRETNGSHLPNVLRDLRRFGLDLQEAERPATPRTPTTEQETIMAVPKPTPPPTPITFNVRQELAELRDALESQGDTAMAMLADAERRIGALEADLAAIRSGGATRGPSTSELVRQAVLAWFIAHPGMRITPQVLEMNLDGQLPKGHGKAAVAGGCRDLTVAGRLQGGGTKAGEAATRGVYWYDPAQDPQASGTTD